MARGKKMWAQSNKKEQTSKATTEKKRTHCLQRKTSHRQIMKQTHTHIHENTEQPKQRKRNAANFG